MEKEENVKKTKTPKQKARLRAWITFLILLVVSLALIIVGGVLISVNELVAGFMILIGVIWFFGNFIHLKQTMGKIRRSYCKACGKKFNYHSDVAWSVAEVERNAQKHTATVNIECHCDCGHTDYHTAKATVAYFDKQKKSWIEKNVETVVRGLFVK